MLLNFMSDWLRDRSLRQRFAADPLRVFDDYGLSHEQRAALRTREPAQIIGALNQEVASFMALRQSDGLDDGGALWGTINIDVKDVVPSGAPVSTPTSVMVTGSGFPGTANAALLFQKNQGQDPIAATDVSVVTSPQGESTLTATASFAHNQHGHYTVVVVDTTDASDAGTWSGTFLVQ